MGPFYCPADERVYFDLDFLVQLQSQFGAVGDLAAQYIVAHEYGHHVQNVLGISGQVSRAQQQDPGQANALLGGPRAAGRLPRRGLGTCGRRARPARRPGEISEALNAAAAVGDDRDPVAGRAAASTRRASRTARPSSACSGSAAATTPAIRNQCDTFAESVDTRRHGHDEDRARRGGAPAGRPPTAAPTHDRRRVEDTEQPIGWTPAWIVDCRRGGGGRRRATVDGASTSAGCDDLDQRQLDADAVGE